jgi:hypothetical protein
MSYIFNGIQKTITLSQGTAKISVRDLWSRWVNWFLTDDNSKFLPAFKMVGGEDINASEGTRIPIYSFLENGWRIKPQESNHTLTVNDGILLVNGGGDPFINTSGAYTVRINYQQPLQAISFSSSNTSNSSADLEEIKLKIDEMYKLSGLDVNNPAVTTANDIIVGDIVIDITGDGETSTTLTRND